VPAGFFDPAVGPVFAKNLRPRRSFLRAGLLCQLDLAAATPDHGPGTAFAVRDDEVNAMKESLLAAIGIWLVFVLVFTSLVGA
jgi:hypothetical protein